MNAFFKRCPFEITSYIMQYTYMPQNKNLLNDIVNFTEKKQELYKLFLDYWILDNEPEEYINWLSNDITLYTNNFRHTGELYGGGYTDIFYDRFFRNPFLKSKENVKKYIGKLSGSNVKKEINIYLGLLTPTERQEFINWSKRD
jgi:hypothetical protein